MKKVSAKEAKKIIKRLGLCADGDGRTFYAYDEKNDEIYEFDSKAERNTFVTMANNQWVGAYPTK